ncbi:hypothetical protein KIL84_008222 [Mauremys mutica]|uniref:Uncharacterized protein n=1 Tax=Mauremys mutica TaxID=74926 RepID=A0A9D4AYL5_9SAUR|nr:hypothetical protein KIL84_008222 [Mauremys mutica]
MHRQLDLWTPVWDTGPDSSLVSLHRLQLSCTEMKSGQLCLLDVHRCQSKGLIKTGVPVRSGDATFPKAMDNVTVRQGESATLSQQREHKFNNLAAKEAHSLEHYESPGHPPPSSSSDFCHISQ